MLSRMKPFLLNFAEPVKGAAFVRLRYSAERRLNELVDPSMDVAADGTLLTKSMEATDQREIGLGLEGFGMTRTDSGEQPDEGPAMGTRVTGTGEETDQTYSL